MSEPTPPGSAPQEPSFQPPVAPPSPPPAAPPPPVGGGYSAGPPISGNVAPAGYANSDEKTWALLAHFGAILVGFIAPLIAYLVKGQESPTVKAHAIEALNFQITWGAATIIASILGVCSFGILFFLPLCTLAVAIIFAIIGGMKANEGVVYHYPMSIRLVK